MKKSMKPRSLPDKPAGPSSNKEPSKTRPTEPADGARRWTHLCIALIMARGEARFDCTLFLWMSVPQEFNGNVWRKAGVTLCNFFA